MIRWRDIFRFEACVTGTAAVLLSVALAAAQAPDPGAARPAAPAPVQEQAQPAPATPGAPDKSDPRFRPGLVDAVGQMLQSGFGAWSDGLKSARDTIGGFGGPAATPQPAPPGAPSEPAPSATSLPAPAPAAPAARLPGGIVSGRERCALAPNGAPDCASAAAILCRANGYATGSSVDFQSAEKCSGRLLASGPKLGEITCRPEHFVTKALCQ